MEMVIGLIVNAVVLVALIGSLVIWARIRERKMTPDAFTIRKPIFIAYAGTFVIAFFGFLLFVSLIGPDADMRDPGLLLVISAFLLVGLFMLADTVYWKVSVDKNRIAYRALFRKSGVAEISDITRAIVEKRMKMTVYTREGKLFTTAITYAGYKMLADRLKQEGVTVEMQGGFL